jgi:hypothetical protein
VISYTPSKQYQNVVISTQNLKNGATYKLTCGDQSADITLSSISTSSGQIQSQGMGGMMGGMGKGGGRPSGN